MGLRVRGGVVFYAGSCGADVWVGVGVDVGGAVDVGAGPGAVVDEDGVGAPAEACTVPAVASEGGADDDGWAEADGSCYVEARAWGVEDYGWIVDGDVVVVRVVGLDLDVAAVVYDVGVGVGGEVAVVAGLAAHALDGVHDVLALIEDGVAELAGPVRVAGHGVEDGGEGQESEDAGIEGEVVGLNGLAEGVAGEVDVHAGPSGGVSDFVPVG